MPLSDFDVLFNAKGLEYNTETDSDDDVYNLCSYRNVLVRDLSKKVVAGLVQRDDITFKAFHRWLNMIYIIHEPWYFYSDHKGTDGNKMYASDESFSLVVQPSAEVEQVWLRMSRTVI